MSSKKLLFIISLVILASGLMSFNANPELNLDSVTSAIEVETDTLPGDVQKRVAELHRKREQIRKEVERIKAEEDAKVARKAEAERSALEKEQKKANKEAIAKIKAEKKAKKNANKAKGGVVEAAEAERLALEKKKQREAEIAARKLAAEKKKAAKKVEAEILAEKRRKQREIDAIEKAKIKAEQDVIAQKEQAIRKVEAEKKKAIKKAEAEILAEKRRKQREIDAIEKAKIKAEQDALAEVEKAKADRLKAIQKAENDKLRAAKKLESERLAAERKAEREAKAIARAKAKAEAERLAAQNGDNETRDLKKKLAKARENVNTTVPDEDPIKAAKKRDAELAKQKKKQERAALAAMRAEQRAQKAALKQQQKEEAAALAAQMEIKRQKEAAAAAQAGLVYDEAPPGVEEVPATNKSIDIEYEEVPSNESIDSQESPRIYGESVEVANKSEGGENAPRVITEGITPPPPPATDVAVKEPKNKTKSAVAQAFEKEKKRKKRKRGKGIKLPGASRGAEVGDIDVDECDFEFNEFDPITQKVKRGLSKRFFFSYTEDILKEYMQGEDYLVCTGGLIDIQGIIALGIKFVIDSPQARYEYGSIGTNAQLILQLIDGETITLLSEQSDSGRVNRNTEKTEFSTIFLINPREEKTLRKTEISAVRMVWGTGYEDYDVNEIDFLIDQFQCIDAARDN